MFVSHDRYFVERLATKIIEVGNGTAVMFPGTYKEFLWHKEQATETPAGQEPRRSEGQEPKAPRPERRTAVPAAAEQQKGATAKRSHEEKKRADAEARKRSREQQARLQRIESLESRIAETEAAIRELEQQMSAPGFYADRTAAQPIIDRHQSLMWQVGDLMNQWEELQSLKEA
jgi:ATP-binding cassette subfamily F protein 3